MPETKNNFNPSGSPLLNQDITQKLLDGGDLSLQSLRLLKSTNRLLRIQSNEEISKRKKLVKEYLTEHYMKSETIIGAFGENQKIGQTMIELCSYISLIKIKEELHESNNELAIRVNKEISRRNLSIAEFLEENMIENPMDGISIAIGQKKNKTATNLIGKYLYKDQVATSTNNDQWLDSREFFNRKFDHGNTIMHLVVQTNDPELIISTCWSFDKAFLSDLNRHIYFTIKNDVGDNPIHHAYKFKNFKSALIMAKGMSRLDPENIVNSIFPQTSQEGLTTKQCLDQSKEMVNQPSTPKTVKKPYSVSR